MDIQQRIDELELIAFHNVPVSDLAKYCDPLQCWPELERPITKEEVLECLRRGEEELVKTPLALELSFSDKPMDLPLLRFSSMNGCRPKTLGWAMASGLIRP